MDGSNSFVKGVFITLVSVLFLHIIILITINYYEQLQEYSGITTFYSLLVLIFLFILKEYLDSKHEDEEDLNTIKSTSLAADQVKSSFKNYNKSFEKEKIPVCSIAMFDIALPIKVKSKNTKRLGDLLFLANDKIEILNERREDLIKIVSDPSIKTEKARNIAIDEFYKYLDPIHDNAASELSEILDKIRKEISRWKIY